jgi:hypothetical protein
MVLLNRVELTTEINGQKKKSKKTLTLTRLVSLMEQELITLFKICETTLTSLLQIIFKTSSVQNFKTSNSKTDLEVARPLLQSMHKMHRAGDCLYFFIKSKKNLIFPTVYCFISLFLAPPTHWA